jgi:hypothetical protein
MGALELGLAQGMKNSHKWLSCCQGLISMLPC